MTQGLPVLEAGMPGSGPLPEARGLRIDAVESGSGLDSLGVRAGDRLLALDGLVPRDVIDLQLELPAARHITLARAGQVLDITPPPGGLGAAGLTLTDPVPGGIRECNNHCEFCFIRGLPPGLRPSLYVFDDDYRYSFLWGNFLTLTNLDDADWARIAYQRLSPLNVSVHASDPLVRQTLLNNRRAPPILPSLERLAASGIEINAQVVLCAGLNDGEILDRTIRDLARLHPADTIPPPHDPTAQSQPAPLVQSISIVPVGLTRFSRVKNIRRPSPAEAARALDQIERWQTHFRRALGIGFVYASDELYVLAGRADVPPAQDYDGFPVLTNGVGLLRSMLDDWRQLLARSRSKPPPPRQVAWLTGRLAAPALEHMADAWRARAGWRPTVTIVDNAYFGQDVTVSGLLSGADLIRALAALPSTIDDVVLPRGPFGFDSARTLDGITAEQVGAAHPGRVHLASTPRELLGILTRSSGRVAAQA